MKKGIGADQNYVTVSVLEIENGVHLENKWRMGSRHL